MESVIEIMDNFKKLGDNYDEYIKKYREITDDTDLTMFDEVMSVFLIKHSKNLGLIKTHLMRTKVYRSDLLASYINILIPDLL